MDLENMGFYEVLLPFILIFTILFAILQKIKLFGEASKNINVVVAVAIAFFVVRVPSIINIINQFLPKISLVVLVLLMFLLVIGILGADATTMKGGYFFIAMLGALVGVIWAITSSIPGISLPGWLSLDAVNKGYLLGIGAFILIAFFLFKEDNQSQDGGSKLQKALESFGSGKLRGQ